MCNSRTIAESDDTVIVEGNHYFSLVVDGDENRDAAWYYAEPKSAAKQIAGRIAFWRGVQVAPAMIELGHNLMFVKAVIL